MIDNDRCCHDFKNHLGIIVGFANLLVEECAANDPRRADLEQIHKAATAALDLLARVGYLVPEGMRDRHRSGRRAFQEVPQARPMGNGRVLSGRRKDGTIVPVEISQTPVEGSAGDPLVRCAILDVSTLERAETALRVSEARYRTLFEDSLTGNCVLTHDGRFVACNNALAGMLGFSVEDVLATTWAAVAVDRYDLDRLITLLRTQRQVTRYPVLLRHRDGGTRKAIANIHGVVDEAGTLSELQCQLFDETEHLELEQRFWQAQKMESVGRMASGIAHDFNNLLTPIVINTELLKSQHGQDSPAWESLAEIRHAADQAAALTRQLLAFGRQQALRPRPLLLNSVIRGMENLIARTLGEDVDVAIDLCDTLWSTLVDPTQVEQALLNLVLNARDAMPTGGRLTVETLNVHLTASDAKDQATVVPGSYVCLAVSDTGSGMDEETRRHLFDPFFTTKKERGGTGLGLASVYGIVKQSGGYIWAYSESGAGTTFKLYFPKTEREAGAVTPRVAETPTTMTGTETILLVEDNHAICRLATQILARAGYTVLSASTPRAALDVSQSHRDPIQLLLCDVILPEMGGPDLSQRLLETRPALKVLFMSGFTPQALVHRGVLGQSIELLEKPFTPTGLLARARNVLDSSGVGA